MKELTSENVDTIFKDCLFKSEEVVDGKPIIEPIMGEGILNNFGFHPERLESHRIEVAEMLSQLPDNFKKTKGGGMSFLNACMTKDDRQWGEHRNMEQLFSLGYALKLVTYPLSREFWDTLPGGVPYITVDVE
jgi:hypothetical protein